MQSLVIVEPRGVWKRLNTVRRLAILAVAVLSAACAGDVSGPGTTHADDPLEPPSSQSTLIRAHPPLQSREVAGMAAIVQGAVEVDFEVGCVWLATPDGVRTPVIWPAGTTERNDPFEIVLPNGREVRPGDLVSGGGGYVPASTVMPGLEPIPGECLQTGEMAVFNADSPIEVTPDVGADPVDTLVGRFSLPQPVGLELIAVDPNRRTVAVADLVSGTVHLYETSEYNGPDDAIDGASGGGGFIHLWSQGTVYTYPGRLDVEPLVYQPEPLRTIEGVASTLEVVPAPDGEHTWLVQDGSGFGPTLLELVNLVEVQVTRLGSYELDGSWQPIGTTNEGLVLVSNDEGEVRSILVRMDGSIGPEIPGEALSVGWNSVAILGRGGDLTVTDGSFEDPRQVVAPGAGSWISVGGPMIPATSPPLDTGGQQLLLGVAHQEGEASSSRLLVLDPDGSVRAVNEVGAGEWVATWSRAGDWVVVVEDSFVTLIPLDGTQPHDLGELIPEGHWVLAAG